MHTIDIHLRELTQLYDSLDPSPFREKSLDRSAEAYLIESVGELPANAAFRVLVHGPVDMAAHVGDMAAAIHSHFLSLMQQAERRGKRRQRIGRAAILLGSVVLAVALLLRTWVADWPGALGEVVAEGLLILAWVALWRPAEIALFDQWESREQARLLQRLARVPVEFQVRAAPSREKSDRRRPGGRLPAPERDGSDAP